MNSTCAVISSNLDFSCDDPIVGGIRNEIILFNFDDFQGAQITYNVSNTLVIEDIILPTGVTGYTYSAPEDAFNASAKLVPGGLQPSYDHMVSGIVLDVSPSGKQQLEKLAKGKVVVLVKNNYKGTNGNAAYELYGMQVGLKLNELVWDKADKETQGAAKFTLASSDKYKEPRPTRTVFITDYATTTTLVDSLAA